MWMAELKP